MADISFESSLLKFHSLYFTDKPVIAYARQNCSVGVIGMSQQSERYDMRYVMCDVNFLLLSKKTSNVTHCVVVKNNVNTYFR